MLFGNIEIVYIHLLFSEHLFMCVLCMLSGWELSKTQFIPSFPVNVVDGIQIE